MAIRSYLGHCTAGDPRGNTDGVPGEFAIERRGAYSHSKGNRTDSAVRTVVMSSANDSAVFDLNRQNDRRALIYRAGADHYFKLVGVARKAELLIVATSAVIGLVAASVPAVQFAYAFWGLVLAALDASLVYAAIGAYRHAAAEM